MRVARPRVGGRCWQDLALGHEMFCAGHFMETAVALNRCGGDARLLPVAARLADHLERRFGPGRRAGVDGHPVLAMVELYREVGERRYLDLATHLIGQRGRGLAGNLYSEPRRRDGCVPGSCVGARQMDRYACPPLRVGV